MVDHQFGERFALMWYACNCGHRERIWNSRNGVTPFGGLLCTSCGGRGPDLSGLTHIEWYADKYAPEHKLVHGQQFWRDGTPEEAVVIIKRRVMNFLKDNHPIPKDVVDRLLDDARNTRGEWNVGWPMVDRYDARNTTMIEKYKGEDLR